MITPSNLPRVALTVPIYNEEERVEESVRRLVALMGTWVYPSSLIIAEDGSTDRTRLLLQQLNQEFPEITVVSDSQKRGRGFALRRVWSAVDADIYAFTDADLPAGTGAVRSIIDAVAGGADVAIASRYAPGAETSRPPLRSFVSRVYNRIVRLLFSEQIHDHQCGIKAFSKVATQILLKESHEDSWFWDTEVVVVSTRRGFKVTEIPVRWVEIKYLRTPIRRLFADIWLHGTGVLKLFLRSKDSESLRATMSRADSQVGQANL